MGKKTKTKEISPVKRHEITQLVSLVLRSTRDEAQTNINIDWAQYLEITKNLDQLRRLQSPLKNDGPSRDQGLVAFTEWCSAGGAQFSEIEVKKVSASYEMGLVAKNDLPADKVFIQIPDNLIFAWRRVENKLPVALRACPLFFDASHVRLAFALCVEKLLPSVEWRPYLDILPPAYRTCLYWTAVEMEELKGSTTALPAALKQCKFIAAQYAFLYKCIHTLQGPELMLQALKDNFTYELYRWAVSTVSSFSALYYNVYRFNVF